MEKFTIGELTEPFLTYEEFAGKKEKEKVEQKKAEITVTEQEAEDRKRDYSRAYRTDGGF